MKLLLDLPPGIVGDDTDFSTPGWRDSSGIRFPRDRPEVIKGWESQSLTNLTGVCRTAFNWSDPESINCYAYGLHNSLAVWKGGESAYITPAAFVPGEINGAGPGYGAGDYGEGDYGEPTFDNFVLTWSFAARYGLLYANPRGQGVFVWDGNPANIATPLSGAPAIGNFILGASTGQIMVFGCTAFGGSFDPACIRISDVEDPTDWTPGPASTSQQFFLEGNGRIVAARAVGEQIFVWTPTEMHVGRYDGTGWTFSRAGAGGLCGPNAAAVFGQAAYWPGPDLQFYVCALGGAPQILRCPIRKTFADNVALGQADKIVGATVSEYGEVIFLYPDSRDGLENSRALRFSTEAALAFGPEKAWAPDELARTAFTDSGPGPYPVGVTVSGRTYWHERGASADGAPLSWRLRSGGQYISPAEIHVMLTKWWPDFRDQIGAISLTVRTQRTPQGPETSKTYLAMAGQEKVDIRISGAIATFEFFGNTLPAGARFGTQGFAFEPSGGR